MNITRENTDDLNAILTVEVEKNDYEANVEKVLRDYRKKANIKGFRPGMVPFGLIKKMYGRAVKIEEINKLVAENIQKYLVAPERMPEHLIWFKWESYMTWISGAALLMVTYWVGSELFLIDPAKMELAPWQAIAISAGSLSIGWLVYTNLCKSKLGETPTMHMLQQRPVS